MSPELEDRFRYHPPKNEATKVSHQAVRTDCRNLAEAFEDLLPEGREKSLAYTSLEQAMFWANAAIARNQGPLNSWA